MGTIRGCGTRQPGGMYLVCGLSPYGQPIENFIVDAPKVLNPRLGVPAIGVKLIELPNKPAMVFDRVGTTHYPNVTDFIEETRRHGMSRRVSRTFDFSKLGPGARQVLCHDRAVIDNADAYQRSRKNTHMDQGYYCPKGNAEGGAAHETYREHSTPGFAGMCAGLWWEDVDDGDDTAMSVMKRQLQRRLPDGSSYTAWLRPYGVTPQYRAGIFMSLPITRIEVVRDSEGTHTEKAEKASVAGLPVEVCAE